VNKFRKWIKVKPTTSITVAKAWNLSKRSCTGFACPTTDNVTQFTAREFKDFCADSGTKINYASVSHP
jgi:hypothetical protein